jgi:hypothetical protein
VQQNSCRYLKNERRGKMENPNSLPDLQKKNKEMKKCRKKGKRKINRRHSQSQVRPLLDEKKKFDKK